MMLQKNPAIPQSAGAAVGAPESDETLVAILSAAASVALGANVRILSFQQSDEYVKYQPWVQYGRMQQFVLSRVR
jgi:hypothetical protein